MANTTDCGIIILRNLELVATKLEFEGSDEDSLKDMFNHRATQLEY